MITHGYTTFCDDIRDEVGGKVTLVGCYNGALIHNFNYPVTIPKLGIATQTLIPPDKMPKQIDLKVDLVSSGLTLFHTTNDLGEVDLREILSQTNDSHDEEERYVGIAMNIIISPLIIQHDDAVRVRAYLDGELVKLGRLKIMQNQLLQNPTAPQA